MCEIVFRGYNGKKNVVTKRVKLTKELANDIRYCMYVASLTNLVFAIDLGEWEEIQVLTTSDIQLVTPTMYQLNEAGISKVIDMCDLPTEITPSSKVAAYDLFGAKVDPEDYEAFAIYTDGVLFPHKEPEVVEVES